MKYLTSLLLINPITITNFVRSIFRIKESVADNYLASNNLKKNINSLEKENIKLNIVNKISHIYTQVAHDIRSPLAALEMVVKDINDIPEQKRIIIRDAILRINDIANDLLLKNKKNSEEDNTEKVSSVMLSDILSSLITEKRLQLRHKADIKIKSYINEQSYGLFASVNIKEFSRVISNLINNSVESFTDDCGIVRLSLMTNPHNINGIQIKILDNGKGISKKLINKLGVKGNSFGKEHGSGLGLFHAKTTIESLGGSLLIESTENIGTTIFINLPKDKAPKNFLSSININNKATVVILDDDQNIHQVWKSRFKSDLSTEETPNLIHFTKPEKFKEWYQKKDRKINLILIDYEFSGYSVNGVDLIKELDISSKSILVTSRYSENNVREVCEKNNIKLLPKGLAVYLGINIVPKN